MERPLFKLGARLEACALFVREGTSLADIGTDHAYLPVWLIKTGRISRAVAADIRTGPLEAAARNAEKYGVSLELRLSDGLRNISPEEAEDVVIAGMGGELIARIVGETDWLRNPRKRLILQPMSSVEELRHGLSELGFEVLEERAVTDSGKVYSAFAAHYIGRKPETELCFPVMGKIAPGGEASRRYAEKVLKSLQNRAAGLEHEGKRREREQLLSLMEAVRKRYL